MTETVVRVTTLNQWKAVLDVWFEQGYKWRHFEKCDYLESVFGGSHHYLHLDDYISQTPDNYDNEPFIEYEEFMEQMTGANKMKTVYVTREHLELIEDLKQKTYPAYVMLNFGEKYYTITKDLNKGEEKELLRYLGGDTSIEFKTKTKEQLYRLWRIDDDNDKIYMSINSVGTPSWNTHKDEAFTATREEIVKWITPAWKIEEVD